MINQVNNMINKVNNLINKVLENGKHNYWNKPLIKNEVQFFKQEIKHSNIKKKLKLKTEQQ